MWNNWHTPFHFPLGESLLPLKYCARPHHEAQSDPPGGILPVHEGGAGHADPGAAAGHRVRAAPLAARGPGGGGGVRLHHAHPDALPGTELRGQLTCGFGFSLGDICSQLVKNNVLYHFCLESDYSLFLLQGLLVSTIFCFFNGEVWWWMLCFIGNVVLDWQHLFSLKKKSQHYEFPRNSCFEFCFYQEGEP